MTDTIEHYANHFDHNDQNVQRDIYEIYRRMRNLHGPLVHSNVYGGFVTSIGYEESFEIARKWDTFSSTEIRIPASQNAPMPPISTDPPLQQEYRKVLNPYFSPGAIKHREDAIRAICTELIDGFIGNGAADLAKDYTQPLPGLVFFTQIVDIPISDLDKCREWVETQAFEMVDNPGKARQATNALVRYLSDYAEDRIAQPPRDDVVSALLAAQIDGQPMSVDRVVPVLMLLIIGGLETTSNALANMLVHLDRHPHLRDRLLADHSLVTNAVEEYLRLEGSLHGLARIVTSDADFCGRHFKAGDRVLLDFAAANRDPHEFDDPDTYRIDRVPNRHLAFGVGVHRCLGSNLARTELRIGLEEILRRIPDYSVAADDQLALRGGIARGYVQVPAAFTARPVV